MISPSATNSMAGPTKVSARSRLCIADVRFAEGGRSLPKAAPASPKTAAPPMIHANCAPSSSGAEPSPVRSPDATAPAAPPASTPEVAVTKAQRRSTSPNRRWVNQNTAALAPTAITTPARAPHNAAIVAVLQLALRGCAPLPGDRGSESTRWAAPHVRGGPSATQLRSGRRLRFAAQHRPVLAQSQPGQLSSMACVASATLLSPLTTAVPSVQKVPAPTSAGIRSEPSKRTTSAFCKMLRNDCSSGW